MKPMLPTSTSRGMTLLEVILYIALSAIILGATAILYGVVQAHESRLHAETAVDEAANEIFAKTTQTIRSSERVISPGQGTEDTTLTLSMRPGDSNPDVFSVDSGVAYESDGDAAPVALTAPDVAIDSLTFNNFSTASSSDSLRMTLTLHYKNPGGRSESEYIRTYYATANTR
jgi:type II secretory pathway pseudopilin PulG